MLWASAGLACWIAGALCSLWNPLPVGRFLAAGVRFRASAAAVGSPAGPTRTRQSAAVRSTCRHLGRCPGGGNSAEDGGIPDPPVRREPARSLPPRRHSLWVPAGACRSSWSGRLAGQGSAGSLAYWSGSRWATIPSAIPLLPAGVLTDGAGRRAGPEAGQSPHRTRGPGLGPDSGRAVHGQGGVLVQPFFAPNYTRPGPDRPLFP
jgi:hypothetical protein